MITFRTFTNSDIEAGLSLCRIAGWNQVAEDWKTFLQANANSSSVAVDDKGRVAGTVTTIGYGAFSWIGMLLVHPDFRKMGIGSASLKEAIRIIGQDTTSRLDATPAGREVYLKLGFKDQYYLTRMVRTGVPDEKGLPIDAHPHVRILTVKDLLVIKDLDNVAFGADRSFLLTMLMSQHTSNGWVYEVENEIKGYGFCREGHNFSYAGPLVAKDISVAITLLSAILDFTKGRSLAIDVPEYSISWKTYLESIRFVQQRTFIRMYNGDDPGEGKLKDIYAIAGPEYG